VENVDEIKKLKKSSYDIAKELNIDHKTVLGHCIRLDTQRMLSAT